VVTTEEETAETTVDQKETKRLLNNNLNPLKAILADFFILNVTLGDIYTYNTYHPYNSKQ
jgi:hypothetical protein